MNASNNIIHVRQGDNKFNWLVSMDFINPDEPRPQRDARLYQFPLLAEALKFAEHLQGIDPDAKWEIQP